jgi:outer membrane protein assembly factor BamB
MEAAKKAAGAKKRRNTKIIVFVVGIVSLALVGGAGLAFWALANRENLDREAAEKLYAEGRFADASKKYDELAHKYPESASAGDYKFLQELSAVRAMPSSSNTKGAFDLISTFLKDYKDDPRLTPHGKEVGDVIVQVLEGTAQDVLKDPHDVELQAQFTRGRQVLDELLKIDGRWVSPLKIPEIDARRKEIDELAKREQERRNVLARVTELAQKPSADAIHKLKELLHTEAAKPTRFDQDSQVLAAENSLYENHLKTISFTHDDDPIAPPAATEDIGPTLLVPPLVTAAGDLAPRFAADRVVFALVRGVLFGLSQDTGDVIWAMRVGIDTAHLPLRVPPSGNTPFEMALVLSADTLTLTAVNAANGETLWKHRLGAASLGRPVIVDRKVYLPTLNGDVEEVELAGGHLLGRFKLGQPLSVGGTYCTYLRDRKQVKQIFFPGDDSCIYVLDVNDHHCEAVLYTEHEAGTLRSEPILLPSEEDPNVPSYLVLCLAQGLDRTVLRTFQLLPPNPNAAAGSKESRMRAEPVDMPERRLPGWPWFPPYRDPEKLITVTDAGVLGLFGINQPHNKDNPLFPLVRVKDFDEGALELTGQGTGRGRAQMVHAEGDELWVLARGRLWRYILTIDRQVGPQAKPDLSWERPLDIGSPLHESQMSDDGSVLFLVTQSPNGQACLATAVDAETGRVRWQRQLGLVCHGDPRLVGGDVVALDQGGGLFRFRPRAGADADSPWQSAGHALAKPLPEGVTGSVYLVPGADGNSVFQFVCPDPGNRLIVREYQAGRDKAAEYVLDLPARLAGTPAVGSNRILVPLANGDTRQLHLTGEEGKSVDGPPWRATRGDGGARGHVVWLGGDDFLTTNGRRGLTRWRLGDKDLYEAVPAGRDARKPTLELADDIAGPPIVLSHAAAGQVLRVCVADVKGTVYLFEGDGLKPVRQWALPGPITAGPFERGGMAGCVVGRRLLVWLDPTKDKPLWQYESPGEGIIGQPQVAEGMVLVADVSGRFVGRDPVTGLPRGTGYQLRASVGPAAAPVGFGADRAFAPLTDATVLLLPLRPLRETRLWPQFVW